ncbi:hypothetical protein 7841G3A7_18 [Haloquadratum phage sp.]|nr:hypothetical protein 7841G3A7_18 [Haloquadratum phage sp.]
MSDLTVYTAGQFINWLTQGQINQPPSQIYVGLINNAGTEISADFLSGRAETIADGDWDRTGQTKAVNQNKIVFSDATGNFLIESVALFESDLNQGGEKLVEVPVNNAPVSVFFGNDVIVNPTELEFDMLDVTQ